MPWWMVSYTVVFALMVLINIAYLINVKSKVLVLFYDLFAGAFLLLMMLAYWMPFLRDQLNFMVYPVFILILLIDMRITIYHDFADLGVTIPEGMTEKDIEHAGAVALIFSAPAYIITGLLCLEQTIG